LVTITMEMIIKVNDAVRLKSTALKKIEFFISSPLQGN